MTRDIVAVDRRGFLRRTLVAAGAWLYGLSAAPGREPGALSGPLLDALLDTLIPEDEFAGALSAGVDGQIERLLADSPRRARLYRRGMAAIERRARAGTGRPFAELPPEERGAILAEYQRGFDSGSIFFQYFRRDAMTAFYSSPQGYAMLGYEPPVNGYPYAPVADGDHG